MGTIWTVARQGSMQVISFLVSLVLARLLLPAHFGQIGMLAIFISVGTVLLQGGLSNSLIRSLTLSPADYSTVFLFNLLLGVVIYWLIYATAPLIAGFFGEPELKKIARVYGLGLIITAMGAVHRAILVRDLLFRRLLFIDLPALIAGSTIGILMASYDFGVWSLVWMNLATALATTILLWWQVKKISWGAFDHRRFLIHFRYGYKLALAGLLDLVFTNTYQVIIGKQYNAARLGYYNRSNTLSMLPAGTIASAMDAIVFPVFSRLQQDERQLKQSYQQLNGIILLVLTPATVLMHLLAMPLVVVLFSERWLPMVPVFQILCFASLLYPLHVSNIIVLKATGRANLLLKLELMKKAVWAVIIAVSLFWGFQGLLWGQVLFSVIAFGINSHFTGPLLHYSLGQQLKDLAPVCFAGFLLWLAGYMGRPLLAAFSNMGQLLLGSVAGLAFYFLLALVFRLQPISQFKQLLMIASRQKETGLQE